MDNKTAAPQFIDHCCEMTNILQQCEEYTKNIKLHDYRKTKDEDYDNLIKELDDTSSNDRNNKDYLRELLKVVRKINKYHNEYGYPVMTYREGEKIGLLDWTGEKISDALYEDACITYDVVFKQFGPIPVKQNGYWGLVDDDQNTILPFEYDSIYRLPFNSKYLVIKNGKQGLVDFKGNILINCEMDILCHPSYLDEPFFFTKENKWGWYWSDETESFDNKQEPYYDEIYFMSQEEWEGMDSNMDEFFEARIQERVDYILMWTKY